MGAKNEFMRKVQMARDIGYQQGFGIARDIMRQIAIDSTVITLGEMGCTPEFLHEFKRNYERTEFDLADEIITDSGGITDGRGKNVEEHDVWKEKIDRKLKEFVLPEDFVCYNDRYGIM